MICTTVLFSQTRQLRICSSFHIHGAMRRQNRAKPPSHDSKDASVMKPLKVVRVPSGRLISRLAGLQP
jgi:hypothetical protein